MDPLQYTFISYGSRKWSKLTWLMVLAAFMLISLSDKYVQKSLELSFRMQYMPDKENVS